MAIAMSEREKLARNMLERVCVGDLLLRTAERYPDQAAVIDGSHKVSYREMETQANRLAHALLGLGLRHQEVVGVMARNCAEVLITYFACAKAGLICAPINLGLKPDEIAYCLNDAKIRVLVIEGELAELTAALPELAPAVERIYYTGSNPYPELAKSAGTFDSLIATGSDTPIEVMIGDREVVQLLYTSGTTAHPKGVLASHLSVTLAALSSGIAVSLPANPVILLNLPLFHTTAINTMFMPAMLLGGTGVLTKGMDMPEAARLIEEHRINMCVFLPMMYAELLADPVASARDFSSVKKALYAMAPMPPSRLEAVHELFPNADVILGSGQTEFTPPSCLIRPEHQWSKAGSWGTATPICQVAIMDDDGNLLPHGEVGEIVYRGPQVMNGYLNQPEQTEMAFQHGWLHSGDVAWMDEDGAIWFTDRKKDMIKTGGENVASIEVERCLMEHPAVAEAAVIGLPHPYWGEAVTATVVLKPDVECDEAALTAHCREHLGSFKVPKAIVIEAEFPRTGTGKIQKHVLRGKMEGLYDEAK